MKKNNLDDYINQLKPLAEQEPAKTQPRNLPMRLKKQKKTSTKLGRYFYRISLAAICLFFGVFIFALIRSNMRPSITSMNIVDQNKSIAPAKEVSPAVNQNVPTPVAASSVDTAATTEVIEPPKSDIVADDPAIDQQPGSTPATPKPSIRSAVPPMPDVTVKTPTVIRQRTTPTATQTAKTNTTQPVAKTVARKEMIIPGVIPKPYKWRPSDNITTVAAKDEIEPATVEVVEGEKPTALASTREKSTQPGKTESNSKPATKVAAEKQTATRTLAPVTKHDPVIEKPVITEPVVEKPRKIPYSKQVASLPVEQRLAKAKQLFDQQQWYDACDIYRKEMYNAGLNKSRRHEVVIRTAQCYYKLGYKSTADHLLDAVINEGGGMKKEAKAILEAHN